MHNIVNPFVRKKKIKYHIKPCPGGSGMMKIFNQALPVFFCDKAGVFYDFSMWRPYDKIHTRAHLICNTKDELKLKILSDYAQRFDLTLFQIYKG